MNDFTIHRLETEIENFKRQKTQVEFTLSRLEPDKEREIDIIERKFGSQRVTLESQIKQLESDIRQNEVQLQQLKRKLEREEERKKEQF